MATRSHVDKLLRSPKQHWRNSSLQVGGNLGVEGGSYFDHFSELGGITPQSILCLHKCEDADTSNYGIWTDYPTHMVAANVADGPTAANVSVKFTAGATHGATIISYSDQAANPILPVDLRPYKYIGFWYRNKNSAIVALGDIKLVLYGWGNTTTSSDPTLYTTIDLVAWTEPSAAVWKYLLLDISNVNQKLLEKVTRFGFMNYNMTAADTFTVYNMEAFYWGYDDTAICTGVPTACGPARGLIMRHIVEPGQTILNGQTLVYTQDGNVAPATAAVTQGQFFAGVALENADASAVFTPVYVRAVVDGVIHRRNTDTTNQTALWDAVIVDSTAQYQTQGADDNPYFYHFGVSLAPTGASACIANDVIPIMIKRGGYVGYGTV